MHFNYIAAQSGLRCVFQILHSEEIRNNDKQLKMRWVISNSYFLNSGIGKAGSKFYQCQYRGGSRAAATSKMERFVIIVNGFQPLTIIITKRSIFDVAAVLDRVMKKYKFHKMTRGGFYKYQSLKFLKASREEVHF